MDRLRDAAEGVDADDGEREARAQAAARGVRLARAVAARYATSDVYEIARRAGVRIERRRWTPITAGECDHARSEVTINAAAAEQMAMRRTNVTIHNIERLILAHELGHHFDFAWRTTRPRDERRHAEDSAHAFAAELLGRSSESVLSDLGR